MLNLFFLYSSNRLADLLSIITIRTSNTPPANPASKILIQAGDKTQTHLQSIVPTNLRITNTTNKTDPNPKPFVFFISLNLQPWQFLVITQIIIFLLGWPLEWTEILIIFVPIFLPLVEFFGVNPYFFAMLIALNLQTSFLTPPMAMSAYYLKGVQSKNVELIEVFKGIMPFLAIVIFGMVLMYLFPGIALWLPDQLFAN